MAAIEIDTAKLPTTCVLDTGVLLLGLSNKAYRPDSPLCRALFKSLVAHSRLSSGARVLIPAPVIGELLRGTAQHEPPKVPGVFVAPFTSRTARLMGQHLSNAWIETVVGATKLPRAYVKYDALIAATAIAYDATLIALDGWFHRHSASWPIKVMKPGDFQRAQLALEIENG